MRYFVFLLLCWPLAGRSQSPVATLSAPVGIQPQVPFPELFKAVPIPDSTTPAWALLMYGQDPPVRTVDSMYQAYYAAHPFVKNLHTQNYKHWRRMVDEALDEQGYFRPPSREAEQAAYQGWKDRRQASAAKAGGAGWTCLGPHETYKNGTLTPYSNQVNVYSLDQSTSHPDILFCGTEAGGVYRSADKGLHWTMVSAQAEFSNSITVTEIHPALPDVVFISGNKRLYRTTDAGATWSEVLYHGGTGHEVRFHPSGPDTVLCATSKGFYRSVDGGTVWTQVFAEETWDVDFHPADPDTVFLLKKNAALVRAEVFRSVDGGNTWTLQDNGWYVPTDPATAVTHGGKIAIPPGMPDRIYVGLIGDSKAGDNGWIGVYRSEDRGDTWTHPAGQNGGPYQSANTMPWNVAAYSSGYHQGFYNFDMEASHLDPNTLWIGTIRLTESADGAFTFQSIGVAESQRLQDVHADIQAIEVNGADIWVASDGGINYSDDELMSHVSRKYGITGSDFWGFGAGWNEDVLVGGRYHNGNHGYYQSYGPLNSHVAGGVEESTGYVHPMEARRAVFSQWWSGHTAVRRLASELGGSFENLSPMNILPNEAYTESNSSGICFHTLYADRVYAGEGSSIWRSTDGGGSFSVGHDFGTGGRTLEIAIGHLHPDTMYVVFKPDGTNARQIYRSDDGGDTWQLLPNVPANNRNKLEITLNPAHAGEIWVCANDGADGNKVYRSTDAGQTWTNRTTAALDGEHPVDILYQGGTDGIVYLVTRHHVFYHDPATADWVDYSTGLPLVVSPLQMRPFYRDSKLRLATRGRGIWEIPFVTASAPLAQPITYSDTLHCSRDTAFFDSYSILDQAGASWQWSFDPAPLYLSSDTVRNPKVVFGNDGSYTVTLTVTDGTGQAHSRQVAGMGRVDSRCEVETIPGQAVRLQQSGDWVQTGDLNLTTHTFTITAWVKPDGIQPDYSAIAMNDGSSTVGFNFREGNNTLGYHYPGGAWWWDSGLEVSPGEWHHVAMVAEPTGVTLYVDGIGSKHAFSPAPVELTRLKFGNYRGWSSRNMRGELDEVAVWSRALSREEIRERMHLTLESDAGDPDLRLYYQFNEPSGQVLNRVGAPVHGSLAGGTVQRIGSNAPVGGGVSGRLSVPAAGEYSIPGTGVRLTYPVGGNYPDGELAAYRLLLPPDELPSADSLAGRCYWIVRHFGSQGGTTGPDSIVFEAVTPMGAVDPSELLLYRREANGYGPTWGGPLDTAVSVQLTAPLEGSVIFSGGGTDGFGQYALTRPPVECPGLAVWSPGEGAVLDNGCVDPVDSTHWLFVWPACPEGTAYQLEVLQAEMQEPLIRETELTDTFFQYVTPVDFQMTTDWQVRVRSFVQGLWTSYSPWRSFVLEPSGTDCSRPCAGADLVLDDSPLVPNEYRASGGIQSMGSLYAGTAVTLQAGLQVELLPGFEVPQGAVLLVVMEGCD